MGLNEVTDIIQNDCSFVSFEGGEIISLLHIPIYKIQTELSAYQYLNIPLTTSDNDTAITIQPQNSILAINLQNELFIELSNFDLQHKCKRLKEKYFCEQKAVLKRPQQKTCLTSLFRQNNDEISKTCAIQISTIEEKVLQLNTTTFLIYTKNEKQIYITCTQGEEKIENQFKLSKLTYLTMKNKCNALLDNHIVTSNLPLNFDIFQKITKIDINFNTVVGIEEKELKDFSNFIKTNSKNMQKPIKITDIRKLYHIEKLRTHNESLWSLFKKFGFACLGITLLFVFLKIIQILWKFMKNSKIKSKPQINFMEMEQVRHVFDNSKCVNEDQNIDETCQLDNQSTSDKIIRFPA